MSPLATAGPHQPPPSLLAPSPSAPTEPPAHSLLYVGIDEAGYGPRLGPLCVALTAFEVSQWDASSGPPNLWAALKSVLARTASPSPHAHKLLVDDSKRLKRSNSGSKPPLLDIEPAILSFWSALAPGAALPSTFPDFLAALSDPQPTSAAAPAHAPAIHPWWAHQTHSPLHSCSDQALLRIRAAQLASACDAAGIRPLAMRCRVMSEPEFNARAAEGGKARASFAAVAELLRHAWRTIPAAAHTRIVIDRQGGRTHYRHELQDALPGLAISELDESAAQSRYHDAGPDGRHAHILFRVEAESAHLPVALASMLAKYVRERLMARFNDYWSARIPELKPTAGYGLDARRWLEDSAPFLTDHERHQLVRTA